MEKPDISRRNLLKGGGALTGLSLLRVAFPSSALSASDEEVLPWFDQPPPDVADNLHPWEELDTWITPIERFFNVNHYGQPTSLDESTWRLDIGGLVSRPKSLTVDEIKARQRREQFFTLECSGDNGFDFFSSAIGNAQWAGTPLAPLLHEAGILENGIEVVFYGVDSGTVTIRDNVGILRPGRTGHVEKRSRWQSGSDHHRAIRSQHVRSGGTSPGQLTLLRNEWHHAAGRAWISAAPHCAGLVRSGQRKMAHPHRDNRPAICGPPHGAGLCQHS